MAPLYDVIVVGSGPAGSSAALRLARAGMSVAVLEKARLPRYKTCGGGMIGRALQAMPIEASQVIEQHCHSAKLTMLPSNRSFMTHRSLPIVSMTMRDQLDFALLEAARSAGAVVHQCCAVQDLSHQGDGVRVVTDVGEMHAKFIIAADGALSTVARKMGIADGRTLIPALEYEVTVPQKQLERFQGVARFDFGLLPHGYGWAFPKRRHLSIGVLSMVQREGELKRAMATYLTVLGCGDATQIQQHGFAIPVAPRRGAFAEKRVLFVGDAAGFADPVTGEGISFALLSGQFAAQALVDGNLNEIPVQQAYGRSVGESILPELQTGRFLARFLYGSPRLRSWAFARQGQRLCEAVTDVMSGTRTYRDLVFKPRTLMKFLSGTGFTSPGYEPAQPPDGRT